MAHYKAWISTPPVMVRSVCTMWTWVTVTWSSSVCIYTLLLCTAQNACLWMKNNVLPLRLEIKNLLTSRCAWIQSVLKQILENFPSLFLNAVNLSVTSWKGQSTCKLHANRILSWMFCWIVNNLGADWLKGIIILKWKICGWKTDICIVTYFVFLGMFGIQQGLVALLNLIFNAVQIKFTFCLDQINILCLFLR